MTQPPAPPSASDWAARLALSVAQEVRRHRHAQGLSAQQLADRCAEIGMPIQRSVLANLESGRRTTINLAEVLVLAFALQVPPGVLMFPVGYEQDVEVLPDAWVEPATAIDWLAGNAFFTTESGANAYSSPLGIVRLHQDAAAALQRLKTARDNAVGELARVEARSSKEAALFEVRSKEAGEIRERLNEIAIAAQNQQPYDADESERLAEAHSRLMPELEMLSHAHAEIKHAHRRVQYTEERLHAKEAEVRELRKELSDKGLSAPRLPREFLYIDPESQAFEDMTVRPEISFADQDASATGSAASATEGDVEYEPPVYEGGDVDKVKALDLLNQLRPMLQDTIKQAVEKAFEEREQRKE
ncbi:Helix-turn-helix domain-containing protein [Streptomyces sp. 2231.1]|uniref:helix-turn-helix domain-containing protein n=1 Tax=Streptomyces sp. 2231.1 TaxID=1855347 RepID=UPI00089C724C|nr:helix-turn-helix transcriptional regulator [Streptomyces sp. 2231.1]SED25953.1 Helix-turn-helix domain-containing protein [Streptomyces sp. 2231.1]